jgi:hypothetical protein
MREQKVRIVATDARYRKETYPAIPIFSDKLGTYLTGQHIIPTDPSTKGNLTVKEMLGEMKLSEVKLKKFPYLIVPEIRVPILHMRNFDLSQKEDGEYINPKDKAEFDFIKIQPVVASSKDIMNGDHYFYIENKVAEAEIRVTNRTLRYKAEKLILEKHNINNYRQIAMLLNYKIADFRVNLNSVTDIMLQDALLDACEKYPKSVIDCFNDDSKEDLTILKLEDYQIITRKDNSFYDGNQFLGDTLDEVKRFMREDSGSIYKTRWMSLLGRKENNSTDTDVKKIDKERLKELISDCSFAIFDKEFDKAVSCYEQAILIDPDSANLKKLKAKMDEALENKPGTSNDYIDKTEGNLKQILSKRGYAKEAYTDLDKEALIALLVKNDNSSKENVKNK